MDVRFSSPRVEARCRNALVRYFDAIDAGNYNVASVDAQRYLSFQIDQAAKRAFDIFQEALAVSPEHQARILKLNQQPTLAGRTTLAKALFSDVSQFEQMIALSSWLRQRNIRTIHSFVFGYTLNDCIPIRVNYSARVNNQLMQVVLGTTKGAYKAPAYEDWARNEPWYDRDQRRFIYGLEGLEMTRQPEVVGGLVIKGSSHETDLIDNEWRYGKKYASVELKGQSGHKRKKAQCAGLNISSMASEFDTEIDICPPLEYSDYDLHTVDGQENLAFDGSIDAILTACKTSLVYRNDRDLERIIVTMLAAKIGPVATPMLRQAIVAEVFE